MIEMCLIHLIRIRVKSAVIVLGLLPLSFTLPFKCLSSLYQVE